MLKEKPLLFLKRINKESVVLIDMDGTLIHTNQANNLAYIVAAKYFDLNTTHLLRSQTRITRKQFRNFPNLDLLIKTKQIIYKDLLDKTYVNQATLQHLKKIKLLTDNIYLCTRSDYQRAYDTIHYHKLHDYFKDILCTPNKQKNKYQEAIKRTSTHPRDIFILEDCFQEISDAINLNIPDDQIFLVKNI